MDHFKREFARKRGRSPIVLGIVSAVVAFSVTACGSSGGGGGEEQPEQLRVIHAATGFDSLRVDIAAASSSSGSSSSSGRIEKESPTTQLLGYGNVVGYFEIPEGAIEIGVRETDSVLPQLELTPTVEAGATQTLLLIEQSDALAGVFVDDAVDEPSSGEFNIRVINAIGRDIDAYIAFPEGDIDSAASLATTLNFSKASNYLAVESGAYRVFITRDGGSSELVSTDTTSFAAGRNYSFVVFEDKDGGTPYSGRILVSP